MKLEKEISMNLTNELGKNKTSIGEVTYFHKKT